MGRTDLIGNGKRHLIPLWQPAGIGLNGGEGVRMGRKHGQQTMLTQHTGLPPRTNRLPPTSKSGGFDSDQHALLLKAVPAVVVNGAMDAD